MIITLVDILLVALFAALLIWAALNDLRRYEIPNRISAALLLLYCGYLLLHNHTGANLPQVDWLGGLIVAAVTFGLSFILFAFGAFGGGDVKLLTATMLWAGPEYAALVILVIALTGGVLAAVRLVALKLAPAPDNLLPALTQPQPIMKQNVPYGVAIAAGGLLLASHILAA